MEELQETLAEKLDVLLLQACLHGKKCCQKRQKDWWSLPLATAWYKVQILLLHLDCLNVGATVAPKLIKKLANKGVQVDLPPDMRQTQAALKNAQKEVKKDTRRYVCA
eukprot:11933850-Ditylum_brightwellii.AAC.1